MIWSLNLPARGMCAAFEPGTTEGWKERKIPAAAFRSSVVLSFRVHGMAHTRVLRVAKRRDARPRDRMKNTKCKMQNGNGPRFGAVFAFCILH